MYDMAYFNQIEKFHNMNIIQFDDYKLGLINQLIKVGLIFEFYDYK